LTSLGYDVGYGPTKVPVYLITTDILGPWGVRWSFAVGTYFSTVRRLRIMIGDCCPISTLVANGLGPRHDLVHPLQHSGLLRRLTAMKSWSSASTPPATHSATTVILPFEFSATGLVSL
jgi:hypothetical protein